MKNLSWTRPLADDDRHYPLIYSVFEVVGDDGGKVNFRIEDLPEERWEEAVKILSKFHFDNDPMLNSKGIRTDDTSMSEIVESWRSILRQKMSIVCYKENSSEIVALSIVSVINEAEFEVKPKGEVWSEVKRIERFIKDIFFNPFEHYDVDLLITGAATYVDERYTHLNIESELLNARAEIAKLFNIRLSSDLFTTDGSQRAAMASGYEENFSIDYKKLPKLICEGFFPGIKEEKMKIMSKKIF